MSWEIRIVNGRDEDLTPLGTREAVRATFAEALPGVLLEPRPLPSADYLKLLEELPPFVREAVLQPKLQAEFQGNDYSIQFYANDEPLLRFVNGEVRGHGDPRPALAAICTIPGWLVIDTRDDSLVDLSMLNLPTWEQFQKWRDTAIAQITAKEGDEKR